jgi:hypothetical protein
MKTSTNRQRINPSVGALWASAFVLAGMVIMQAGRLGVGNEADASVTNVGEVTVLTANTGANEDVILVLDDRTDALLVYGVENRNRVELYQNLKVSDFFQQARGQGSGGRSNR